MGAGTPLSTSNGTSSKKRWWLVIAGTVAVVAAGGLATQFWKSQPGSAAEEAAGTAKLTPGKKTAGDRNERAVAVVNNEKITEDMLARECISRHGKEVLEDLINRLIIQQACEAQNKKVTQQEVEAEIVTIAKKFNLDPGEWQKMLQSERNITPEQYRLSVIWPMLALKKLASDSALDDVKDEDVEQEFERQYGERVKCRMIMCDSLRHAQKVWNECKKKPEEFDKLAQEHSIDPNSRSLGGAIPPIPRYSGNDTIEKAAFKLKPGEISAVVEVAIQGTSRYAILKCEGRTQPVIESLDEPGIREQIVNELKERKTQENIAKVFEQIKKETTVRNHLTGTNSGPEANTVNPAGKVKNGIKQTSAEKPAGTKSKTASSGAPVQK